MGFLRPLLFSLLTLCITPSGESNIFSVDMIRFTLQAESLLPSVLFPRQVLVSRVIYERSKRLCPQDRSDIKSATVFILARSFIIKRLPST